jgi:hypothetical protein
MLTEGGSTQLDVAAIGNNENPDKMLGQYVDLHNLVGDRGVI